MSTDKVPRVLTGPRAAQSSAATGEQTQSEAAFTEHTAEVDTTVQDSMKTGSVRRNKTESVIEKLVGYSRTETGMLHSV